MNVTLCTVQNVIDIKGEILSVLKFEALIKDNKYLKNIF